MRKSFAAITALGLLIGGWGTARAQCTSDDLASKNAEKCAKHYAKAVRKCIKAGISLDVCDTSKSDEFCNQLSGSCTPTDDVDEMIQVVYGDQPTHDKCLTGLAKQGTKYLVKRYTRFRQGKHVKLSSDAAKCALKAPKKCKSVPTLQAPCDGSVSLEDVAACVCSPGCADLTLAELHSQGTGTWETELTHAENLGFVEVERALLCEGGPEGQTLVAVLRDPTAAPPEDVLTLLYRASDEFSFFVKMDAAGIPVLFNVVGGLRILPDAAVESVGPDGAPSVAGAVRAANNCFGLDCRGRFLAAIVCAADQSNTIVGAAGCGGAIVGYAAAAPAAPYLETLGGFVRATCGKLVVGVLASAVAGVFGVDCKGCGNTDCEGDGKACTIEATCRWGRCRSAHEDVGTVCGYTCNPDDPTCCLRTLGRCDSNGDCQEGEVALCKTCSNCIAPPCSCGRDGLCYLCTDDEVSGCLSCPPCGNGVIDSGEQCDRDEAPDCPGQCLPPRDPNECSCPGTTTTTTTTMTTSSTGTTLPWPRFVDNGDGTVTDRWTRRMWEKKSQGPGVHDVDAYYAWCGVTGGQCDYTYCQPTLSTASSCAAHAPSYYRDHCVYCASCQMVDWGAEWPIVSTVWDWLEQLNGFAGYNDWRMPEDYELREILLEPYPCATNPCIDPIFGPTKSFYYWSRGAGEVSFIDGMPAAVGGWAPGSVRAVRNVTVTTTTTTTSTTTTAVP